jgi:hypothetical protein
LWAFPKNPDKLYGSLRRCLQPLYATRWIRLLEHPGLGAHRFAVPYRLEQ